MDNQLIVIFGGAGYIGSVLTKKLLDLGYKVRVFDNFLFGDEGIKYCHSSQNEKNLEVINGTICDTNAVASAINGADTLVLLSAIAGHNRADIKWFNTRNVNFYASSVVLDAAEDHGVSRFIFASSATVYGNQNGIIYETTQADPQSLYSRLKLRMEERVIHANKRDFRTCSLRIGQCYGFSPRMRFDLLANSLVRDAIVRQKVQIPDQHHWKSFIHVNDTADAFVKVIEAHENNISGEIFNVTAKDQNIQISEIAEYLQAIVPEGEFSNIDTIEEKPIKTIISSSKIEKTLNFNPQHSIREGLSEIRNLLIEGYFEDPYNMKFQNG